MWSSQPWLLSALCPCQPYSHATSSPALTSSSPLDPTPPVTFPLHEWELCYKPYFSAFIVFLVEIFGMTSAFLHHDCRPEWSWGDPCCHLHSQDLLRCFAPHFHFYTCLLKSGIFTTAPLSSLICLSSSFDSYISFDKIFDETLLSLTPSSFELDG